jgi:hypothetical protein
MTHSEADRLFGVLAYVLAWALVVFIVAVGLCLLLLWMDLVLDQRLQRSQPAPIKTSSSSRDQVMVKRRFCSPFPIPPLPGAKETAMSTMWICDTPFTPECSP